MKFIMPAFGVALLVGIFVFSKNPHTAEAILCPSAYPTAEEATASFQLFINNYFDTHPGASMSDVMNARHDFYVSHDCAQELAAYQQYQEGKADPTTMANIDAAVDATMQQ